MPHALHWVLRWMLPLLAAAPAIAFALTPSQVFDKVKDSVLVVKALDAQGTPVSQGSGVMLPSGKIATNCHVLEAGARYQVGEAKRFVPAILHAEDADKDLCLLDAPGFAAKAATLGMAARLKVGEAVYSVSSPKGLELSLSDGIVSQLRGGPPPFIQTTAAISRGSSGGGLFDSEGRLVGITTFYLEGGQSLNFALPVEWLAEIKPDTKRAESGRPQGNWLARAMVLEQKQDWQGLLDWCRQWTRADPGNALAWADLGQAYGNLKRNADAIEAFRQAIRIQPDMAEAWYGLGVGYGALGRVADAIEAYRQALRIQPDIFFAWYDLGNAYAKLGRHADAIEAFRQTLRIWPEDADAWFDLAIAYQLSGDGPAALAAVQELRRYDPARADKLFDLLVPR